MIKRIVIDPRSRINYASYYIGGLFETFGEKIVTFGLLDLPKDVLALDIERGCTILIEIENGVTNRIFIDSHDSNSVVESIYQWVDVYAKINVKPEDAKREKLLVIGPSFGIKLWNPIKTITLGIKNYLLCKKDNSFSTPLKTYLSNYAYTFIRRKTYDAYYGHDEESSDYCFALSTLWYDHQTYSTTNRYRGVFAKACQRYFSVFEGGFFYIPSPDVEKQFPKYHEYLEEYKGMLITKRIGMQEYLMKTRKSAIVFNTPSVLGCHGWKLGEYLAMGKAIISTPLNNLMPGDFRAGIHYIETENEEEISDAVKLLKNDERLRLNIKQNAKAYFDMYLSPVAVIKRIIERCS